MNYEVNPFQDYESITVDELKDQANSLLNLVTEEQRPLRVCMNNGKEFLLFPQDLPAPICDSDFRLILLSAMRYAIGMWKTMQDMGIHTGGGSDAPVESFNVLENIFCAVTRQRIHSENHECHCPQECLDIKDAVALFTSKAAYLTFEENKKGTIEVGKYADLVVLSDDIFQIDAQKIQDVAVLKTMVNGEFVFSKE